jgi:hypothetical protein
MSDEIFASSGHRPIAERMYARAGITPEDVERPGEDCPGLPGGQPRQGRCSLAVPGGRERRRA